MTFHVAILTNEKKIITLPVHIFSTEKRDNIDPQFLDLSWNKNVIYGIIR